MSLSITAIPALRDNYIYALSNEEGACAIVDPGEAAPVIAFLEKHKLQLCAVLCTHHHHDHIDGVKDLVNEFQVPVWTSVTDQSRILGATQTAREGETYELLGQKMHILELPGHTLGQIAFWWPEVGALFAGDTLFSCGCGRLFEGTHQQMFASLHKIKQLPSATQLYFGHEYTLRNIEFLLLHGPADPILLDYQKTCRQSLAEGRPTSPGTLQMELRINPFLRAETVEEFRVWRDLRNEF